MTNTYRESVNLTIKTRNVSVGTTAVLINDFGFKFVKGIQLYAPGSSDANPNTETIWLGNSGVTADQAIETGGFPLVPGSSLFLPSEYIYGLYVISATGSQILTWVGV